MANWEKLQVVCGAFLTNFLIMGPMKCMGVYFLEFQVHLDASAKSASLVMSIMYGTYFFTGPVVTVMCTLFGYKTTCLVGMAVATLGTCLACLAPDIAVVYVTLGLCLGAGASMINTPMYALVGQLFTDKRPLVNNVVALGGAIGSVPLSLLAQIWVDEYGWRGSLLLMGGVVMNSLPAIFFTMNGARRCDAKRKAARRKIFDTSLLTSFHFPFYCLACGLHMASMVLVSTYLVRYAQSRGISNIAAAGLSSIIGAMDVVLKPIVGYLASLTTIGSWHVNRSYLLGLGVVLQAIPTVCLPFATEYIGIVMAVVAWALCIGICGALPITVLSDLFGPEKLPTSLGIRSLIVGTFSLVTPPLVGIAVDATETFTVAFYFSAALTCIAGPMFVLVHLCVAPSSGCQSTESEPAVCADAHEAK